MINKWKKHNQILTQKMLFKEIKNFNKTENKNFYNYHRKQKIK